MNENERTEQEREAAREARDAARRERTADAAPPRLVLGSAPGRRSAAPAPAEASGPRVPRRSSRSGGPPREPRPPRPTRSRREPRPARGSRHPRRGSAAMRRAQLMIVAVLGIVVIAVIWFLVSLFQPFAGSGTGKVQVAIPTDASTSQIATLLDKRGVIGSTLFFKLRARLSGDHFRSGAYVFTHGMSYGAALHVLSTAPGLPPTTSVTIIPGKSRYQLNRLLRSQGVAGSYSRETLRSRLLKPSDYGAPRHVASLEGFLYPNTYQLREPISIRTLVDDQLTEFKQQMAHVSLSYAKSKNLSAYDVVKIASLEEAEAALPDDLPKVASVIYNRLKQGMDLGLDTTAAYAANNYGGNLTSAQLNSASAWNTLDHHGLPPTPINSPDLAAINAAAHPAHTDYLYFIVKVCGNGALNFTDDYQQFLAWSRQYSQALARKGAQKAEFCGKHA